MGYYILLGLLLCLRDWAGLERVWGLALLVGSACGCGYSPIGLGLDPRVFGIVLWAVLGPVPC